MTPLSTEFKVGAFFFLTILLGYVMMSRINDRPDYEGEWLRYTVYFDNATGLLDKTPVEIAGIKVGHIISITLENDKAKIALAVDPRVKIKKDAVVSIKDRGLLGERYIDIYPGIDPSLSLPTDSVLPNSESQSPMVKAFQKFETISTYIENITKSLDKVVTEGISGNSIKEILENVEETSRTMKDLVTHLDRTVLKNDDKLTATISSLEAFSRELRELYRANNANIAKTIENVRDLSGSSKNILDDKNDEIRAGIANLAQISEKLNAMSSTLHDMMKGVSEGKGTAGKLLKDEEIAIKLEESLDGVNQYLSMIRQLSTSIGYRAEFLSDQQEFQNIVQISLQPRPDKYFLLEFVDSPSFGDLSVTETQWQLGDSGPTTKLIERRRDDGFTFSLEFCKSLYDVLTMRFGLIRSQGGVAMDYHLFDKRLTFTMEAFDFSREERPQLRSVATLTLFGNFLLAGGVDDMITSNTDKHLFYNSFISLGVRFRDDDLRAVLSSLPSPRF